METINQKYNSNEVVVNNRSNFKSHLVKCQSIMDNNHYDNLVLKGMGKATFRAINLALQLNSNNFNTFEIKPRTYSVEILENKNKKPIRGADRDSFNPDQLEKTTKTITHVPAIEIIVSKSKIELEKIRKIRKQMKDKKS